MTDTARTLVALLSGQLGSQLSYIIRNWGTIPEMGGWHSTNGISGSFIDRQCRVLCLSGGRGALRCNGYCIHHSGGIVARALQMLLVRFQRLLESLVAATKHEYIGRGDS